jgi:hypothetical protein
MPEFMFERFSLVSPASILNPIFSQKYFPPRFAGFGDDFCFGERKFPRRLERCPSLDQSKLELCSFREGKEKKRGVKGGDIVPQSDRDRA